MHKILENAELLICAYLTWTLSSEVCVLFTSLNSLYYQSEPWRNKIEHGGSTPWIELNCSNSCSWLNRLHFNDLRTVSTFFGMPSRNWTLANYRHFLWCVQNEHKQYVLIRIFVIFILIQQEWFILWALIIQNWRMTLYP